MRRADVAIAGAGPVGAALALALARAGYEVAVIERREPPGFDPAGEFDLRVFALAPASRNLLTRLGAWDAIERERIAPIRAMHVWRAGDSAAIGFDGALVGEPALGWIVEGRLLGAVLWQALAREPRIELVCPGEISALESGPERVHLVLADGGSVSARLLVAADGAESRVRGLAGIGAAERDYGERAVVAHLRPEQSHRDTAWQRFLDGGPLALLPLRDGRVSIVWTLPDAGAQAVLALDDDAFGAAVTAASEARLGRLTPASARAAFPLKRRLAERYVSGRVVLVGDAAHVVHPLAGQGMNLGLLDVASLAEALDLGGRESDPGDPARLLRYQRRRLGDNALAARSFEALHDVYLANTGFWPGLRDFGVGLIDRIVPLKRELALQACGYGGDVPPLARRLS